MGHGEYKLWFRDNGRKVLHRRLIDIRGFLNYVTRTYPWMNPYLKEFHLTIDGSRGGRTLQGWCYTSPEVFAGRWNQEEDEGGLGGAIPADALRLVTPKLWILRDL